eukprot:PITA_18130
MKSFQEFDNQIPYLEGGIPILDQTVESSSEEHSPPTETPTTDDALSDILNQLPFKKLLLMMNGNKRCKRNLKENVFMSQPEGFAVKGHEHKVCKLVKYLYGLKQAPQAWYEKLTEHILKLNFNHLDLDDATLFVKKVGKTVVYLVVYVDDLLMTGNNESYIASIKKELETSFEMIDLGYVHYYLGIKVTQHPMSIFLSQKKYIGDLLTRFGMTECNSLTTPMEKNLKLTSIEGKEFEDATKYRQLVGNLNYLTTTRPEISFAVGILSRFMKKPCEGHWFAAKRVLKYLKGTQDYGIKYTQVDDFSLIGYSDLDFDGDKETGVSTSGYAMSLGSGVVSWRSRK